MAGGTALALQLGHRMSDDLDFFTSKTFRTESIISAIKKTGLVYRVIYESEAHLVVEIDGVKFSLFHYEYPFIDTPVLYGKVSIAGILDIASMKLIAIAQRGSKRDFADMYFILQRLPFHKVAGHAVRCFGKERVNPLVIGKALVYFADADKEPEPRYMGQTVKWEKVKSFFQNYAKQFCLDLQVALND